MTGTQTVPRNDLDPYMLTVAILALLVAMIGLIQQNRKHDPAGYPGGDVSRQLAPQDLRTNEAIQTTTASGPSGSSIIVDAPLEPPANALLASRGSAAVSVTPDIALALPVNGMTFDLDTAASQPTSHRPIQH